MRHQKKALTCFWVCYSEWSLWLKPPKSRKSAEIVKWVNLGESRQKTKNIWRPPEDRFHFYTSKTNPFSGTKLKHYLEPSPAMPLHQP
jgi:hypothetical protein